MPQRPLSESEIKEARRIFGDALDYAKVRVVEGSRSALAVATLASRIKRVPSPDTNAFTLGNTIRFSRQLKTKESDASSDRVGDIGWLIHELTHVWQFRHFGLPYLFQAIRDQVTQGSEVYDYSGKDKLQDRGKDLQTMKQKGKSFHQFNREQQGDIARDFYFALKQHLDVSGWLAFIEEMRSMR